jgi:hypothetical protein
LDSTGDIDVDQLRCVASSVFDEWGKPADTMAVAVKVPVVMTSIVGTWDVNVSNGAGTVESFTVTFENRDGWLVATRPDGTVSMGVELAAGTVFWMDMWLGYLGDPFWGTGNMYFGNIFSTTSPRTMSGVVVDGQGAALIFTGVERSGGP